MREMKLHAFHFFQHSTLAYLNKKKQMFQLSYCFIYFRLQKQRIVSSASAKDRVVAQSVVFKSKSLI